MQGPPPPSLTGFPQRNHRGTLWRAAQKSPWWYCSCLACRFDLPSPRGACYLGTDELVGVLESIGAEISNGVIAQEFLDRRRLFQWTPPGPLRAADLVSRRAVGFNVTNELSTMTPYTVPQTWAGAFDGAGFAAVSYRTRFDTGATSRGVAHFGPAGTAGRKVGPGKPIDDALRQRLERECGVVVAPPPSLSALTVVP